MNGFVDIYTLIFLVLAVVIFFKLRSVLGQRTGQERPPFDPFSRRTQADADGKTIDGKTIDGKTADGKVIDARPADDKTASSGDNVVPLPGRGEAPATVAATVAGERIAALAPAGSPLAAGLAAILAADRSFDPQQFLDGARTAYEMIVTAFAHGDKKMLKPLLGREVFDGFTGAINEREMRGETVEFNFVGIDKAEITDAAMKGQVEQITVRFLSKLVSATRNKAGEVVDGDPVVVADVTDIWTFAREANSRDPNWMLVATETV